MKLRQWQFLIFLPFFFLVSCEKYYLTVKREYIDQSVLASTFVGSPDPRQNDPPKGQELIIEWRLAPGALDQKLVLVLKVLYRDYTQETFFYPVDRRRGVVTYYLLNDEHKQRRGFLTYKAEITTLEGAVVHKWQQKLWTDLIAIDEPLHEMGMN